MNKILFLLGMVFCLNAQAGVAIVNESNSVQLSEDEFNKRMDEQSNNVMRADVIKTEAKYRTLATRGQCRALDGSGRQICEPGQVYERTFLGFEVTYQYKGYVGTYFTHSHPGAFVYLKESITPVK